MAESKKRARKSKIQVREFVDEIPNSVLQISDDEESLLPDEVQEPEPSSSITEPAPPAPTLSILKKILPPSPVKLKSLTLLDHNYTSMSRSPTNIQSAPIVSVRVEVEEIDESRIGRKERTIDAFQIEFNNMYTIADLIRTKSSNVADKYLSIEMKNVWGRALRYKNQNDTFEALIQSALHSWSYIAEKQNKESPLFYQCHVCYKAWWFLEPFRQHIRRHDADKLKVYFLENLCESFIVASYHMSLSLIYIACEGDCYRCGNPYRFHVKPNKQLFVCKDCDMELPNCTAMWSHQQLCTGRYHDSYAIICNICSARFELNKDLKNHLKQFHIVRSDVVVTYVLKICAHCQQPYLIYIMHMCTRYTQSCQYCYRNFFNVAMLKLHVEMGRKSHCKICNLLLEKNCMETQHMLTHTENFRMAYKCMKPKCPPTNLFKDEPSVRFHTLKEHKKTSSKIVHEKVLVPRLCMEEQPCIDMIRFVDYNKSTNSGDDDWCLSGDEGHGRAYQISDHVIVKEELQELEPRESVSDSDEGEMGYAEMLSKVFNVTTDDSYQKPKKPAKVENRTSISIQPTKEIEPSKIKIEPNTTENQIPENGSKTSNEIQEKNVNKSKTQLKTLNKSNNTTTFIRIAPKPLTVTSGPQQTVKQYENTNRKNLPKIWQVQSMAPDEAATSQIQPSTSKIQPRTSQIQPSTSKIQPTTSYIQRSTQIQPTTFKVVSASHIFIPSTSQNQPSTSQIQSNTSQKPIPVISKFKQVKKSSLESQFKNAVVQNQPRDQPKDQSINQPKIKTEPIDFDDMEIGDDPITIKEEPIEACLGTSYSAAYFNTENDNGQMVGDQNDSSLRNQSDSSGTPERYQNSQNDSKFSNMQDRQSDLEKIKIKYEPSNDESEENIEFSDEFHVANLLAVKMDPEDVRKELMNGDDFDVNDYEGDVGKAYRYKKTTFPVHQPWIKKKITLLSSTGNGNMKLKKIMKTDKVVKVFEKELEKSASLVTSDSSPESDKIKMDKKCDTDESEQGTTKPKRKKYSSRVKYDREGNRLRKVYKCNKCGYMQNHKLFQLHKKSHCKYSPLPHKKIQNRDQSDSDDETKRLRKDQNETDDETKSRYHCTKCDKKYDTFSQYLSHFTKHGYVAFDCPVCDDSFEKIGELVPHFHKHVRRNYVRCWMITDVKPDEAPKKHQKCLTCRKLVEVKDFFQHYESHLNLNVLNKFVSKNLKSDVPETSRQSIDDQDTGDLLNATWEIDLDALGEANESRKKQKKLSPTSLWAALKQLKGDVRSSNCGICGRHFSRRHDVKRHIIEHLLPDAYAKKDNLPTNSLRCQLCEEDFWKADSYKFHMREHGALPVYRCVLCNKTFSDSSNFAKHKKIHNMRVLTCDICSKKFHVKSTLEKHMIMHMTMDPIFCKLCKRKFYCNSQYKKHIRIMHRRRADFQFKCPQCDEQFHSLKEKWDHAWEAHGDRKYKADCPRCHLKFRKFSQVKNHAREEHGIEVSKVGDSGEIRVKPDLKLLNKSHQKMRRN